MSNRSRQTFLKRQKELARQERQRVKSEKRTERRADKEKPEFAGAGDPDIAGITPGPQPLPWDDVGLEFTEESEEKTSSPD